MAYMNDLRHLWYYILIRSSNILTLLEKYIEYCNKQNNSKVLLQQYKRVYFF